MNELIRRANATDVVLAKFRRRAFDWKTGATCLHLARAQLLALGHKPPRIPPFRSAIGARRALDRSGHADLAAVFDGLLLDRQPPAAAIVGDIGLVPGSDGFDAIYICADGAWIGWHEASPTPGLAVVHGALAHITAAWRT